MFIPPEKYREVWVHTLMCWKCRSPYAVLHANAWFQEGERVGFHYTVVAGRIATDPCPKCGFIGKVTPSVKLPEEADAVQHVVAVARFTVLRRWWNPFTWGQFGRWEFQVPDPKASNDVPPEGHCTISLKREG